MTITKLTGSLSSYYKASYKNYESYALTEKEACGMLQTLINKRGVK